MTPRELTLRVQRLPFVVSVTAAVVDWHARRWINRRPGRSFADYYVARNEARTNSGRPHPTLGRAGYAGGDRRAVKWTAGNFHTRGLNQWSIYLDQGLEPGMRTVDYGCGSLRLGQHAISYLDADRYCGVDPSPLFILEGAELLDPKAISAKRPWLDCLTDEVVHEIGQWKPQFIFSHAVLQHVPKAELPTYFTRLGAMMGPASKAVIMFPCSAEEKRIKAMSWAYPEELLECIAAQAIPSARIAFDALPDGLEGISGGGRRLMILRRID